MPYAAAVSADPDGSAPCGPPAASCVPGGRLERALAEQRAAVEARDRILATVAHDLRNPLGVIRMSAELMEELGDAGGLRERVGMVRRSAEQMSRLVDDLLDLARIESGRLRVERLPEDAGALVREAAALLRPLAERAGLALDVEVERPLPRVMADRERVLQALGNLVGNALKFTPAGGRVTLLAGHDGEAVRLGVRDTGPGIDPAHLPRLFDPYWQGAEGDRRGVGLGLAIVRGIVEAHGGALRAESAPGRGTTLTFTLP